MGTLDNRLYEWFGYSSFKHNQREIIESVLSGEDVFLMTATGSGKSLCYQLPALLKQGTAIIVSPLLALMENQVQELKQLGIKNVASYNSFLSLKEKKSVLNRLPEYKLIYISPESLQQKDVLDKLSRLNVSLLAVDEAHCISQWGHEFRTDYLKIGEARNKMGSPPCLALTATAAPEVRKDILDKLNMKDPVIKCDTVDRTNISIRTIKKETEEEKRIELIDCVRKLPKPGMVYVGSRKKAEELAEAIKNEMPFAASAYHGGMTKEDRHLIQQQFLLDEVQIICCTNAFGMGINKPNIRFVIHFDYPKDIESYVQEMGRAGRDGQRSTSILLYTEIDHVFPRKMIEWEFPTEEEVQYICEVLRTDDSHDVTRKRVESYGFEDVHARFISHYWEEWRNKEDARSQEEFINMVIKRRKGWKFNKLIQMEEWISNNNKCRRETLLETFGETLQSPAKQCCDVCGITEPLEDVDEAGDAGFPMMSWQDRLYALLQQQTHKG
ncbi:ATP-dependent DNA helicase RecQ [Salibacterium salarium]|uniref:RecQ family ATP-dependent DNA helicase n=1 Tax=Salibacterium salarium TaxID=284579 RepID=UPI00278B6CD5|nr:ATP-dependent DNA helicase RecQ [Salibacterium salarium]MDQ0299475.1 ATP-dependent DNA helicase RecQ [Salibacterium salarium]